MRYQKQILVYIFIALFSFISFITPENGQAISNSTPDLQPQPSSTFNEEIFIESKSFYNISYNWTTDDLVFIEYQGLDGGNKDVEMKIYDEDNFSLFANDNEADAIISLSKNEFQQINFLPELNQTYYLVLSNDFSLISSKIINLTILIFNRNLFHLAPLINNTLNITLNDHDLIAFNFTTTLTQKISYNLQLQNATNEGFEFLIFDTINFEKFISNQTYSAQILHNNTQSANGSYYPNEVNQWIVVIRTNQTFSLPLTISGTIIVQSALPISDPGNYNALVNILIGFTIVAIIFGLIRFFNNRRQEEKSKILPKIKPQKIPKTKQKQLNKKAPIIPSAKLQNISRSPITSDIEKRDKSNNQTITLQSSPDQTVLPKKTEQTQIPQPIKKIFCEGCGSEIDPDIDFCPLCLRKQGN